MTNMAERKLRRRGSISFYNSVRKVRAGSEAEGNTVHWPAAHGLFSPLVMVWMRMVSTGSRRESLSRCKCRVSLGEGQKEELEARVPSPSSLSWHSLELVT